MGQTWYVSPTPVVGAGGALWTKTFVAGYHNPWIPTACVQGIAPPPGGVVAGGAPSRGQTSTVSPTFVAAGNFPVNSVPVNASTYAVQAGDNLFRIARHFGVNLSTLASVNGISDPSRIYVGQALNTAAAR
ncbi:MAG TPA: LysM peptidoglycan-binding domain-containing protein [Aggregatilineaceae bacterium]|nr:LysM peptidoglycan-binding domain-containing protein [Aggregatilineaceae bacterium]